MNGLSELSDDLSYWNVIYTRSRAEKKVAELLLATGITAYCPVKEEIRQWSDRKKKVQKCTKRAQKTQKECKSTQRSSEELKRAQRAKRTTKSCV